MKKLYELSYYQEGTLCVVYAYGVTKMEARGQIIRAEGYVEFEEVKEVNEADLELYIEQLKANEVTAWAD